MPFRTVLPLPAFVLHPLTAVVIAAVHVYLAFGHLSELIGGDIQWTHIWKGFGAWPAHTFRGAGRRSIGRSPRRAGRAREPVLPRQSYHPYARTRRDEWRSVGANRLDLRSFANRADYRNSRDRSGSTGTGGFEDTSPDREPPPWSTVCDPDRDRSGRYGWTASGCAARNRGRDLGSGIYVAGCARLAFGCNPLFGGFDVHERRFGADAARALTDDGRAQGL